MFRMLSNDLPVNKKANGRNLERGQRMETNELKRNLAALRSGDMAAFEEIYNSLKLPAYTVIVRITRNDTLAEDILQEVFVRLYLSPPAEDVKNPRAYILQMAHHLAVDSAKKRRPDVSLEYVEETAQSAEQDLALKLDIEDAIRSLDMTDSQIVTLHLNGGLTFREVAGILAMPLGTVLWRYQRSISKLRTKLSGGVL